MAQLRKVHFSAASGLMALALLAGCKSDEQKALEQAKAQAAATSTSQQIQYVDKNGDTVTTVVSPPVAGQPQQVQTSITPPPPGPPPHRTRPIITPYGAGDTTNQPVDANGNPLPPQGASTASSQQPGAATQPGTQPSGQPGAPLSLTVPAGTELAIRINQHISVKTSHAGDHFSGEVVEPVTQQGIVVIPPGTPVSGRVDEAHRRGHFKGRSILELRLTAMTLNGYEYGLDTHDNVHTKKGKGKRSGGFIGGLTGAGMIIGGIASGGVGLAIGAASGAGAGTLIAGGTGNRDIEIPAESIMHFRLADQLVVQNP
jgi:hypothetical protein